MSEPNLTDRTFNQLLALVLLMVEFGDGFFEQFK